MGENKNKNNREYKDSVFVDLFSIDEKTRDEGVISLYNALHQEKISAKDRIEFIKLMNVLFRNVRNDVSFIVNNKLIVLLEHQSTINDNLPLRFLEYIVSLYQVLVKPREKFEKTPIHLLKPEFYVIYNGKTPYPARKELLLSKLFQSNNEGSFSLELIVTVININHPDNQDFLNVCPILNGYKKLTEKVEKYKVLYGDKGYALAIEECIKENMEISDYLKYKMREVMEMLSAEYNYALELEASKEDGRKEGIVEGMQKGIQKGIQKGRLEGIYTNAIETAKNLIQMKLSREDIAKATGLSLEEVSKL